MKFKTFQFYCFLIQKPQIIFMKIINVFISCLINSWQAQLNREKTIIIKVIDRIIFIKMQNNDLPSTAEKSNKRLPRPTCSPIPFPEESSTLSLNFQDLKTLMRKKQKEYQNQLQIEDAQRVHNLILEIQLKKRAANQVSKQSCKSSLKKEISQYNQHTIQEFKRRWLQKKKQNKIKYEQISNILDEEHQKEVGERIRMIQQIKSGKNLENIKYSKTILELQDQLKKLVKTQHYDEAYLIRSKLQTTKNHQLKRFITDKVRKQEILLQKLKKKQQKQKLQIQNRKQQLQNQQSTRQLNELNQLMRNLRTYQIDVNKIQISVKRQDRHSTKKQNSAKKSFLAKNNIQILKGQIITIVNNEPQATM